MIKMKWFALLAALAVTTACAELQKNAEEGLDNVSDIPDKVWTSK